MSIHPGAIVSPKAELGAGVAVGPFAIIEEGTRIGDGCVVSAAAQVRRGSRIGAGCRIGSGAIVGADPQSKDFDLSIPTGAVLGDGNELREYVTVHRAVTPGGDTVIGRGNYLMTGVHIGHDCRIGDENVMANNALLGGHVEVGNRCFFGGGSVYHQFVRIGDYVMVQGLAGMSLDMPPFVIAAGVNYVSGINAVGLKRAGFSPEARKEIKEAFRRIYLAKTPVRDFLAEIDGTPHRPELAVFLEFLGAPSKKGICIRYSGDE